MAWYAFGEVALVDVQDAHQRRQVDPHDPDLDAVGRHPRGPGVVGHRRGGPGRGAGVTELLVDLQAANSNAATRVNRRYLRTSFPSFGAGAENAGGRCHAPGRLPDWPA